MTRDSRNLDGPFAFDSERLASQAEIGTRNATDIGQPGPEWRQEVEVLRATVQDYALAHDTLLAEIHRLRQENRSLRDQLDAAQVKIVQLARQVFGRKSERQDASATSPESGGAVPDGASPNPESVPSPTEESTTTTPAARPQRSRGQQPGQPGHGRRRHPDLPTDHVFLTLSEAEQRCPRCGLYAQKDGMETSEQLDFVVEIRRKVYHRQRYRRICTCPSETPTGAEAPAATDVPATTEATVAPEASAVTEEEAVTEVPVASPAPAATDVPVTTKATVTPEAPAVAEEAAGIGAPATPESSAAPEAPVVNRPTTPRTFTAPLPLNVIPRGLFTINFLVQLLAWKYGAGVPLHRLRKFWAWQGAAIAAGTLVGALQALVPVLEPLYQAILAFNREEPWWHADETHWKVFIDYEGKVGHRWWIWVFIGPRSTVYVLSSTRSAAVPKAHLQSPPPPAEDDPTPTPGDAAPPWLNKLLLTDFYSAYRAMFDGLLHAWCWAHIRRKVLAAGEAVPALAAWSQAWIARIARLYALHAARAAARPQSAAWQEADQALRRWVQDTAAVWQRELADPTMADQAHKVLATIQRQWEGLILFLDHLEIPLDNNEAERAARTAVMGRKNYYGSRAEWSGKLAAMLWTVWMTAIQNGRDPLAYLTAYFTAYAQNGHQPLSSAALAAFLPQPTATANATEGTG